MVHRQQVLQGRGGGGGEGGNRRGGGVGGRYHPLQPNKGSVCRVTEALTEKDVCTSLYVFSSLHQYRRPTQYGRCSEPKPHPLWV